MVPKKYPRKVPKVSRHPRLQWRRAFITLDGSIYADDHVRSPGCLRACVVGRVNEQIEVDRQGVVLVKDGKRHVLYLWGTVPGLYLPH